MPFMIHNIEYKENKNTRIGSIGLIIYSKYTVLLHSYLKTILSNLINKKNENFRKT